MEFHFDVCGEDYSLAGSASSMTKKKLNQPSIAGGSTRIGDSLVDPWGIYEKISLVVS